MRIYTGDDVGLIKVVTLPAAGSSKTVAVKKPRLANTPTAKDSALTAQTIAFGSIDKSREVQILCFAGSRPVDDSSADVAPRRTLLAGLKGGVIRELDAEDGTVLTEFQAFEPDVDGAGKYVVNSKTKREEHFVGLSESNGVVMVCTDLGRLATFKLEAEGAPSPILSTSLGVTDLKVMRAYPKNARVFATGGDERDLCVWDLEGRDAEGMLQPTWKAKNVKNNYLDLRVPIHITDLQFLDTHNPKPTRIATISLHRYVRLYDLTAQGKRPLMSIELGENPLKLLTVVPGSTEGIVTDTMGGVTHVDLSTMKHLGGYKGHSGAVTGIGVGTSPTEGSESGDFVITVSLDRFLRVFEKDGQRRALNKVFLKQRLTTMLIDDSYVTPKTTRKEKLVAKRIGRTGGKAEVEEEIGDDDGVEEDVGDMFDQMEEVGDTQAHAGGSKKRPAKEEKGERAATRRKKKPSRVLKHISRSKSAPNWWANRIWLSTMHLVPRELDKLVLHQAGCLAQKRLARGVRLNHSEACALIASQLVEFIRDGKHSVSELMDVGRRMLGRRHVMGGVAATLHEVQIEGTFPDGTKLVTVHDPISSLDGDMKLAMHGSFLPVPDASMFPEEKEVEAPGAVIVKPGKITLNEGRARYTVKVTNNGDRPVQVGSHYHFIETNASLSFDRALSYGRRLDIPAGTAVRFEPGETKLVSLTEIGGDRVIRGGNGIATGPLDQHRMPDILARIAEMGFAHEPLVEVLEAIAPYQMDRSRYADAYGPTVGDRVRLGDTSLYLEIEKDFTTYGDEAVFGGGKVIREGMGQAVGVGNGDALDLVITNAIIVDYTGIYKADIGIKGGYIKAIGKSGNPHVMEGVSPGMVIGVTTEVLSGEGHIFTAGAIDTHIHFICPQIATEAISSGITTLIGGGTGPNTGTNATTCTPGTHNLRMMLESTDDLPLNFGFTGKGNSSSPEGLVEQIEGGAIGLKLHEDWGTTPAAIDACLTICDKYDVQATIHTDTLNESGFVETSIAAFKGRTIHAYHSEGAGGGHAPDIITVCGVPNVIPSSTNPTRPFTKNTLDEHLDMLMVCHHLSKDIPEDIAFAESRIRGQTIGAEDVLHDLGAISIISSDSQAMGRVGEVVARTWQTADKMRKARGVLPGEGSADNFRIRRFVAKYTINPALAHGVGHIVGSIEPGKFADLVMYKPAFFGTKPEIVIKGGVIAWAQMGDANASIPTPQPVISRPMFGAHPSATRRNCLTFVSAASVDHVKLAYSIRKMITPVKGCRAVSKRDMKLNDYLPKISVDSETYEVTVDGKIAEMGPAETVPLSQSVYIF
ncbi:hypothetical protein HK101_004649 [Irineochytrium annulatum]|nr:hypothetical protein HK101_004649 [Irineochytrium annulatum]